MGSEGGLAHEFVGLFKVGLHGSAGGEGIAFLESGEDVDVAAAGGSAGTSHGLGADNPFLEESADGAEELGEDGVLAGVGDLEMELKIELHELRNGELEALFHGALEFFKGGEVGGGGAEGAERDKLAFEDDAGFREVGDVAFGSEEAGE